MIPIAIPGIRMLSTLPLSECRNSGRLCPPFEKVKVDFCVSRIP